MATKRKKGHKKRGHRPKSDERQLELFEWKEASKKHKRRHLKVGEGRRYVLEREQ